MGKQPKEPTPVKPQRLGLSEAKLAACRANGRKGGRPRGGMNADKLELSARCRVKDARHVEILEDIAENSPNEGYRMTAIRDLMDRGHGRPRQAIDGGGQTVTINLSTGVDVHPDFGKWDEPLAISPPEPKP